MVIEAYSNRVSTRKNYPKNTNYELINDYVQEKFTKKIEAGINNDASCHTFRHSFATH